MSADVGQGSVITIRKKLFGPGIAVLVLGVALLVSGYLTGQQRTWAFGAGLLSVAYGIIDIIVWRFRPVLWIAPWGIGCRRHALGRKREYPRDSITGWSEENSEIVIRVTGASNIKISPADLNLADTHRLTRALRDCGYEHLGLMYGGV